jgi:hypothetical protein
LGKGVARITSGREGFQQPDGGLPAIGLAGIQIAPLVRLDDLEALDRNTRFFSEFYCSDRGFAFIVKSDFFRGAHDIFGNGFLFGRHLIHGYRQPPGSTAGVCLTVGDASRVQPFQQIPGQGVQCGLDISSRDFLGADFK